MSHNGQNTLLHVEAFALVGLGDGADAGIAVDVAGGGRRGVAGAVLPVERSLPAGRLVVMFLVLCARVNVRRRLRSLVGRPHGVICELHVLLIGRLR